MIEITIRKVQKSDAQHLFMLNELFNGPELVSDDFIQKSLEDNPHEIVIIAFYGRQAAGFCCGQITKSFCYEKAYGEITELFVVEHLRNKGIGGKLIGFMERLLSGLCAAKIRLMTGKDNQTVQRFYEKTGYTNSEEIIYVKSNLKNIG